MTAQSPAIIDAHVHFVDSGANRYPVFAQRSAAFESLVGDYAALPRRYRPDDYHNAAHGFSVVKTVWAEFVSEAPLAEMRWAQELARACSEPHGAIASADFANADVARLLDDYASIGLVRAVRQHLAWHPTNPLLRFAPRPDMMADAAWRRGIELLEQHDLACEIEIMAPQLPSFAAVARSAPDLQFILPLLGWPTDLTSQGFAAWKHDMAGVSACPNVAVKIFGLECIFGLAWTMPQVRAWIRTVIDLFGPSRCMFASHMPIALLSRSFQELYGAYLELTADLTAAEQRQLFHDTAARVYKL
jgi:predicted TIM-barrel fold metal-dependent hydrolase